ncbi:MAG: hypothetical protein KJ647_05995, partial [Candidatus Omnitrophica bacterium]|nr:hypothetical protein [Candidatus Omnitrophota bacterium]
MNIFISCRKFKEVLKKEGIRFALLKTKSYLLYLSKKRFSKAGDKKELKVESPDDSSIEKSNAELIESKNFGSGKLRLFLDGGKAKLYWGQAELTKQFGMHSAFKTAEKWYDSSQAQWSIKGINEDKLHISLNYQDIPIEKSWLITFIRPDELSWEVEMRIKQPLFIQNRKVGLFLSDNYTRWFNSCEEGQFPEG